MKFIVKPNLDNYLLAMEGEIVIFTLSSTTFSRSMEASIRIGLEELLVFKAAQPVNRTTRLTLKVNLDR